MTVVQNSQISYTRIWSSFEIIASIKKLFELKSFPHIALYLLVYIDTVHNRNERV